MGSSLGRFRLHRNSPNVTIFSPSARRRRSNHLRRNLPADGPAGTATVEPDHGALLQDKMGRLGLPSNQQRGEGAQVGIVAHDGHRPLELAQAAGDELGVVLRLERARFDQAGLGPEVFGEQFGRLPGAPQRAVPKLPGLQHLALPQEAADRASLASPLAAEFALCVRLAILGVRVTNEVDVHEKGAWWATALGR